MSRPVAVKTPRRVWKCDVCQREDVWGDTWMWFTSGAKKDRPGPYGWNDPQPEFITCSDVCRTDPKSPKGPVLK